VPSPSLSSASEQCRGIVRKDLSSLIQGGVFTAQREKDGEARRRMDASKQGTLLA